MVAFWLLVALVLGALGSGLAVWLRRGRPDDDHDPSRTEERGASGAEAGPVADLGRDLLPPLRLIQEQIDRALVEGDPAVRDRALRAASRQARRAERLTVKSELFARLQAGAVEARLQDMDVARFLDMLVSSFEEVAERRGLTLEFVARPRSILGRTDPEHLTTIVSNLVSSATRNTASGGRLGVAIEATSDALHEPAMRIVVTDTGSPETQERSDALRSLQEDRDDGVVPRPGSAALGLTLVRGLTRLLGGEVTIETSTSGGARFVVLLPLPATAEPLTRIDYGTANRIEITDEILFRTTEAVDGMESPDVPPTFLAVQAGEDGLALAPALKDFGTVLVAHDATSALELAQEHVPDVIVASSIEDERALVQRLGADERTSHIPFLVTGGDFTSPKGVANAALDLIRQRERDRDQFQERAVLRRAVVEAVSVDQEFVDQVVAVIEERLGDSDFSVPELADAVALSTSQLTRKLRSLLGQTPGRLIRRLRLERGRDLLASNAGSVGRIAFALGFADQAHFTRLFKREYGMTPTDFRRSSQPPEGRVSIGSTGEGGEP